MKLNELIRQYRKDQNLTQEQLANYLGVSAPAVNKWENGISYPDITLLSPLARILKTDVNTLLSFHEQLTQQEENQFLLDITTTIQTDGYAKGFEKGESIILEYPTCDSLILSITLMLNGYLALAGVQDRTPYEGKIINWLELMVSSKIPAVSSSATAGLSQIYLQKKDFTKAQSLLDSIPPLGFDKRATQIIIYMQQENYQAAYELNERMLYEFATKTYSTLLSLLQLLCTEKNYTLAENYAALASDTAKMFNLDSYMIHSPALLLAAQKKDKEKCLTELENLFQSFSHADINNVMPLYSHTTIKATDSAQMKMILFESLKTDHDFDFLREDPDFIELMKSM